MNEINNITTTSEYPDFLKLPNAVSGLYYSLMIHTVIDSIVGLLLFHVGLVGFAVLRKEGVSAGSLNQILIVYHIGSISKQ